MTVREFDADEHRNNTEEMDGETRIYCANCGDPEEETGYTTPEQLRVHVDGWHEVDGSQGSHLCCSVYCAAKFEHGDEEKAQEARAQKTSENAGQSPGGGE